MKESAKSKATFVFIAGIVRPLMTAMMSKKWEGTEKLPAGGFIAAPNHCTEIDPLVVGHMLYNNKRAPHFLAKAALFKVPGLGWLLRATKQVPVERSTAGANRSLQVAQEIVSEGGAIIIYPEGTLTRDPGLWPMKGHTGAAVAASPRIFANVVPQEPAPRTATLLADSAGFPSAVTEHPFRSRAAVRAPRSGHAWTAAAWQDPSARREAARP